MTYKFSKVSVIDNSIFGSCLSDEHGRWKRTNEGSDDFIPNVKDIVHLGKYGLIQLAMNIKSSIIRKKSQPKERFSGGRGDYARAVERGTPHQGDQSH